MAEYMEEELQQLQQPLATSGTFGTRTPRSRSGSLNLGQAGGLQGRAGVQQGQQNALAQLLAGTLQARPPTSRGTTRSRTPRGAAGPSRAAPANAGQARTSNTGRALTIAESRNLAAAPRAAIPASAQRTPLVGRAARANTSGVVAAGSPVGAAAVDAFVQANQANCPTLQAADVAGFVAALSQSGFNSADFQAFLRGLYLSGILPDVPDYRSRARWGGGQLAQNVEGVRGTRGELDMNSAVWYVLGKYCDRIPIITAALAQFLSGQFAMEDVQIPPINQLIPDEVVRNQVNQDVADFVASHPDCAPNRDDIVQFLAIADEFYLNGADLAGAVRDIGLEGYLGSLFSQYDTRFAGRAFTPVTIGVTPQTWNVIKASLLWGVAERYCNQLGRVNQFLYNALTGNARTGLLQAANLPANVTNVPFIDAGATKRNLRGGNPGAFRLGGGRAGEAAQAAGTFGQGTLGTFGQAGVTAPF